MTPEQSMRVYMIECALHAAVLDEALDDAGRWMPISIETHLDKELLRILDQIAYRFTKLQDSMGEKVLPLIIELAQEPVPASATFAEKLNTLERMGAIPAADEWKKLRIARNAVAHEYPDDPELRTSAINRFFAGAKQLSSLYRFVMQYIDAHFPELATDQARNEKP